MNNADNFLIKDENVYSGALSCRGCGWTLLVRHLSSILGEDTVYVVPASCFSIIAGPYPMNSVKGTIVHTVFAAASATATGVRASLDRQGKQASKVVVLAGDGGTFDIGLQSLSGAASRGEDIIYICNNNGAYMNTGVQTSTATPYGAITTTNPAGKKTWPKNLVELVAAHNVPYLATASLAFLDDFRAKIKRMRDASGFRFLMLDSPCPPGHKYAPELSIDISRLVVESKLFPLMEIENGEYKITYFPAHEVPVRDVMKLQGRFSHLFK
ncbi:MAG: thiamine pyrophosphate-dependent enzyme, partial [bacterium]|nr:thiamine pyrophosphate-dependent enzyme [bacterium]